MFVMQDLYFFGMLSFDRVWILQNCPLTSQRENYRTGEAQNFPVYFGSFVLRSSSKYGNNTGYS